MNGKTFKQQIYLISEYLYNKEGHIAGAKSGAFEFDYSKEKPTLTLKKTDELAWLCITQNVLSLIKLSHITDEWEDGQTPAGFFANDTSIDTFEQSVQESGMSKKDYLAQWGFTEKQFENLQQRIEKKYPDGLGFNLPRILENRDILEKIIGTHPDYGYIFDPYHNGFDDLDLEMDRDDLCYATFDKQFDEVVKRAKKNDGILVVNDDEFNQLKSFLPHIFEIGAMQHCCSLTAEWLPTNCIEDLFYAENKGKLTYYGDDTYKDEYARFLLQQMCVDNGIKLELDVKFDSIKNDTDVLGDFTGLRAQINWRDELDMSKNQLLKFFDKNDELKRVYFTSSGQFDNAEKIAISIMSEDNTLNYATSTLSGDAARIEAGKIQRIDSDEPQTKARRMR